MGDKRQYASCLVDGQLVGIAVEAVQEVTNGTELTPVPLAPPIVSGLLNLRGQIVTAIDLRRCLQLPDRLDTERPFNLILRTDDGCVSLLVDQVGDVVEVNDDDFAATPLTLQSPLRELITCVYKLDDSLLLVLDTERALASAPGRRS